MLPQWEEELPWLKETHSQVLQQVLLNLDTAYKNFFAKGFGDYLIWMEWWKSKASGARSIQFETQAKITISQDRSG